MKKSVIFTAIGGMLLLLLVAVIWDSLRFASSARHRVSLADLAMQTQEVRLVKLLADSPQASPEVKAAVTAYNSAAPPPIRRAAYDKLVASFRQTMSEKVDPTNPVDRRFMDDIAGAINRREVAEKQYDVEWAAYHEALGGFRGRIARMLSAQARADWSPDDQGSPMPIQVEKEH
jgi:hypothetical protein